MTDDIHIRTEGRAGRITLTRPKALNALTHAMCLAIDAALEAWASDDSIALVLIDAEGDKAFCAGGDIAAMYHAGKAGDLDAPRRFWRDEYRMNARIAEYPKPVVCLMQGFTMGGGVGLAGHASHRIVCDNSRIAMPECGIGFVPDVGGTYLLACAPGRLGEYLGLTAARMGPGDAIHAGFADSFVPQDRWDALSRALCASADVTAISTQTTSAPKADLEAQQEAINALFAGERLEDILKALAADGGPFAHDAAQAMTRNSPLSMALTLKMLHDLRGPDLSVRKALEMEYRVAHRILDQGDFVEGIRAAIIDKDRAPRWKHAGRQVPEAEVARLLMPLGADALDIQGG